MTETLATFDNRLALSLMDLSREPDLSLAVNCPAATSPAATSPAVYRDHIKATIPHE